MKVIMPTHYIWMDRRVLLEAQTLQNDGFEVEVLALRENDLPAQEYTLGIKIKRLKADKPDPRTYAAFQFKALLIKALGKLRKTLLKKLFNLNQDFIPRNFISDDVFTELFSLDKMETQYLFAILQAKPDIIHVHDTILLKTGVLASRILKVPLIYDAHDIFYSIVHHDARSKRKFYELEKEFVTFPNVVITVNEFIAEKMANDYGIKKPEVLMNCAKAPDDFEKGKKYQKFAELVPGKKIALFQGALLQEKGLENLILSAEYLKDDQVLIMMGYSYDEAYLKGLKELAAREDLKDKVVFHPAAKQDELLFYTASADLGIIPYVPVDLNTQYSSPNKLFEYIAAGLPTLANDLIFFRKMSEDYGLCRVIPFEDPKIIGETIGEMLSDETALEEMRQKTIRASETLCWEEEGKKLLNIYNKIKEESLRSKNILL